MRKVHDEDATAGAAADLLLVLTTLPGDADPVPLARTLIDERLAACVNVLPVMVSVFRWQNAVEEASERQLIIKTTAARSDALLSRLQALHPYDVPELIVLPAGEVSDTYLAWAREATGTR